MLATAAATRIFTHKPIIEALHHTIDRFIQCLKMATTSEEFVSCWSNKPLDKWARSAISRAESKVAKFEGDDSSKSLYDEKEQEPGLIHRDIDLNLVASEFFRQSTNQSLRRMSSMILLGGNKDNFGIHEDFDSKKKSKKVNLDLVRNNSNQSGNVFDGLQRNGKKQSGDFSSKTSFGSLRSFKSLSNMSSGMRRSNVTHQKNEEWGHQSFSTNHMNKPLNASFNASLTSSFNDSASDSTKVLSSSFNGRNSISSYGRLIETLLMDSTASIQEQRLHKVGKYLVQLVQLANNDESEKSDEILQIGLQKIMESNDILKKQADNLKVPKVRFGKTNLEIPIVTLGCMRFQQSSGDKMKTLPDDEQSSMNVHQSLKAMISHAITVLGMNHIETAKNNGCSDGLQIGQVLKELYDENITKREDLIIQIKVNPTKPKDFRKLLDASFTDLQVDYVDLFTFNGLNLGNHFDLLFNKNGDEESLIDIIREYQREGKIKFVGFSTHGQPEEIRRFIETDQFDYCNLHYHYFGSYTASGGGQYGGNLENVRLMKEKDMGVSISCACDKGGYLFTPSKKLRSLTLPELEPIQFGSLWLWAHEELDEEKAPIHTFTMGAARPSDLDEPAVAAYLFKTRKEAMLSKVKAVVKKLDSAQEEALGEDWMKTWYEGVPNCQNENDIYQLAQIVSLYNLIKSFGMLDYAKYCYESFDQNTKNWDMGLSPKINKTKNKVGWGLSPGITPKSKSDFLHLLQEVPERNKFRVVRAIEFVYRQCSSSSDNFNKSAVSHEYEMAYDIHPFH